MNRNTILDIYIYIYIYILNGEVSPIIISSLKSDRKKFCCKCLSILRLMEAL